MVNEAWSATLAFWANERWRRFVYRDLEASHAFRGHSEIHFICVYSFFFEFQAIVHSFRRRSYGGDGAGQHHLTLGSCFTLEESCFAPYGSCCRMEVASILRPPSSSNLASKAWRLSESQWMNAEVTPTVDCLALDAIPPSEPCMSKVNK